MEQDLWLKKMRLRRPEDFRKVWSQGRSWAHSLFILWALPNDIGHTRIGITASRKVGNAVDRNRARRLLREAARQLYRDIDQGWDLVFVARSALPQARTPQVLEGMRALLDQAHLVRAFSPPSTQAGCADAGSGAARTEGI